MKNGDNSPGSTLCIDYTKATEAAAPSGISKTRTRVRDFRILYLQLQKWKNTKTCYEFEPTCMIFAPSGSTFAIVLLCLLQLWYLLFACVILSCVVAYDVLRVDDNSSYWDDLWRHCRQKQRHATCALSFTVCRLNYYQVLIVKVHETWNCKKWVQIRYPNGTSSAALVQGTEACLQLTDVIYPSSLSPWRAGELAAMGEDPLARILGDKVIEWAVAVEHRWIEIIRKWN